MQQTGELSTKLTYLSKLYTKNVINNFRERESMTSFLIAVVPVSTATDVVFVTSRDLRCH